MALYNLAILGTPTQAQLNEITEFITSTLNFFSLTLGRDVGWYVNTQVPTSGYCAAVYYADNLSSDAKLADLQSRGSPIIPVYTGTKLPDELRDKNWLSYQELGTPRIATALLEYAGLLPKKRRIFISYRREQTSKAATQLFECLSARNFEVFLDTHKIRVADDFVAAFKHELTDSDVLIMLHTHDYFESDFTKMEFHGAHLKGIPILRIVWPKFDYDPILSDTTVTVELTDLDFITPCSQFSEETLQRIFESLEHLRCKGYATRSTNLIGRLKEFVEDLNGTMLESNVNGHSIVQLANGKEIIVYPALGSPTVANLHEAAIADTTIACRAVLYDHIGLRPQWQDHLDWLASQISAAHLLKMETVDQKFQDWVIAS